MKKILGGKIWTAVSIVLTLLLLAGAAGITLRYYVSMNIYATPSMFWVY